MIEIRKTFTDNGTCGMGFLAMGGVRAAKRDALARERAALESALRTIYADLG